MIDRYQPDLMWFDGGEFRDSPYEPHTLEILCHYLNRSVEWDKEVSVLNKLPVNLKQNFPPEFGVLNYEAGRSREGTVTRPWNDDLKIGDPSWGYVENQTYLTGNVILHNLIDRVSRGGSLMLSISPMADGTIPDEQRQALREIGSWLKAFGEAIYDTRAWKIHGEGDDEELIDRSGVHTTWDLDNCTAEHKRYTQSKDGNNIYAITLGQPTGQVIFESLGTDAGLLNRQIQSVRLLGGEESQWQQQPKGLVIDWSETNLLASVPVVWQISV